MEAIQPPADAISHDRFDSLPEISPRDSRHADQRRFSIELADAQYAFCIDARLVHLTEHGFVACTLTFFDEPRADPPHQRMEPEDPFDSHVDRGQQVVS